jgi:hypothetical protein
MCFLIPDYSETESRIIVNVNHAVGDGVSAFSMLAKMQPSGDFSCLPKVSPPSYLTQMLYTLIAPFTLSILIYRSVVGGVDYIESCLNTLKRFQVKDIANLLRMFNLQTSKMCANKMVLLLTTLCKQFCLKPWPNMLPTEVTKIMESSFALHSASNNSHLLKRSSKWVIMLLLRCIGYLLHNHLKTQLKK